MSVGLICEFNPFHYGHQYIIDKIHSLTGEQVICVMSGPFVQRGEPACVSKYSRTRAAILSGADAVIELPVKYATASAKNFAIGGVNVLKNIKGVTALAFGVETKNTDVLFKIAQLKESEETQSLIKEEMSNGISYPNAVANAIAKISDGQIYGEILSKPNNILAIEYICALSGTGIKPLPIERIGNGYNDTNLSGKFVSASALRQGLNEDNDDIIKYLPAFMLNECKNTKVDCELFDALTLYALRKLSIEELALLPDMEDGLEYSIKRATYLPGASLVLEEIKSKRYTYARLKRIFLYALLGINKHIMSDINSVKTRVLGIKKENMAFLSCLSKNIITRNSQITDEWKTDKSVALDSFAQDVYSLLTMNKGNAYYKEPMIII
ncbi:MAG: nucleotidyltransferase family protein [Clostridiales bacterium]|nr:nucleotidyltransferase family protein [Clostridiales bacterium]